MFVYRFSTETTISMIDTIIEGHLDVEPAPPPPGRRERRKISMRSFT